MPSEKQRPGPNQHTQHPNSLLARIAKNPEQKRKYDAWRKRVNEDAQSYERAAQRGWV